MMVVVSLAILVLMAFVFGALLGFSAIKFKVGSDPIVDHINQLLPQTQCGQCGYPGCKPYAEAIANGDEIVKCIPGGESTIKAIATLLNVTVDLSEKKEPEKKIAFIDESNCIGCTKCIQACPVDAIVGSTKVLHTVIVDYCTGCELCVAPCPTDCITLYPANNQQWLLQRITTIEPRSIDPTCDQESHL